MGHTQLRNSQLPGGLKTGETVIKIQLPSTREDADYYKNYTCPILPDVPYKLIIMITVFYVFIEIKRA